MCIRFLRNGYSQKLRKVVHKMLLTFQQFERTKKVRKLGKKWIMLKILLITGNYFEIG